MTETYNNIAGSFSFTYCSVWSEAENGRGKIVYFAIIINFYYFLVDQEEEKNKHLRDIDLNRDRMILSKIRN